MLRCPLGGNEVERPVQPDHHTLHLLLARRDAQPPAPREAAPVLPVAAVAILHARDHGAVVAARDHLPLVNPPAVLRAP